MNDGNTGYPWSTGDVLLAADLNAAIANAAAIGTAAVGVIISTDTYLVKDDYVQLTGPVSWSGSTITVAGANFTSTDVGKTLIVPFGGGGIGPDAPALVHIISVTNPTTVVVDAASAHAFANASQVVTGVSPTITTPGGGGALVGDLLTMQAGTLGVDFARAAVFYTLQIKPVSVAAVNTGVGGTPGSTVYLHATTGHGRRALYQGTVTAAGALDPATLALVSGREGTLYQNMKDPTAEPLVADQVGLTLPCSWVQATSQLTVDAAQVHSSVVALVRLGMAVSAPNIPQGAVITAIDSINPYLFTFAPAALTDGHNVDVRFIQNSVRRVLAATFANNSTTLSLSVPLPSLVWVDPVTGTLIFGPGIVGGADPTDPAAAQTRIIAVDVTRTILTISQPTTAAYATPVNLTINPILTGVTASVLCVPAVVKVKDGGAYTSTLTGGAAYAVTGGANTGCTITPGVSTLRVNCGTDNAVPLANWAAAVRAAVAASLAQGNIFGAGIEAVWRPGNYFSTGSINLVGLAAQGLFFRFNGAVLHSAAPNKIAIDMRASRFFVLDHPTIVGDGRFPPAVGIAFGRFDDRQGSDAHIRSPFCWGSFSLAGLTFQHSEGFVVTRANVNNSFVPSPPVAPFSRNDPAFQPGFGIVVDGWQHWHLPCDFGTVTLPADTYTSFLGLFLDVPTAQASGGGVPWAIGGTYGTRIVGGYAATWGQQAILFFGDNDADVWMEIHCEVFAGPDKKSGVQDAIMMAAISPANNILQFNASFRDFNSQAHNAILTWDKEGVWGTPGGVLGAHRGRIDVETMAGPEVQVFDRFPGTMGGLSNFGGDIIVGTVLYTAVAHLENQPSNLYGSIHLGDAAQNINLFGYAHVDSLLVRGPAVIDANATVYGQVIAQNGIALGDVDFPQGTIDFDGINITSTKPISLPTGSVAVTQAPGDSDTSVATTAFVQAAALSLSTSFVYTATGGTTPISAQDRAGQTKNIKDFGAPLDGTNSDAAAIGATLAALKPNQSLLIPSGANGTASIVWGGIQGTTPATPVLFKVDGTTNGGGTIIQAFNRVGKGDVFETFANGVKFISKQSAPVNDGGTLRVDWKQGVAGGTAGATTTPLLVNATDIVGAVSEMWGIHVEMNSYSNGSPYPANVAVSANYKKHGFAWGAGFHSSADDDQNLPSSTGGTLVGMEIGYRVNNVDDAANAAAFGGRGVRLIHHLSAVEDSSSGVLPAEISWGFWVSGSVTPGNSILKSVLGVSTNLQSYQIIDARGANVPSGYTSPLAAVRMSDGQIIDFSGGAALNSPAGNYLQHTATAPARLRYMLGTTEAFAIADNGSAITGKGSAGVTTDTGGHLLIPFCAGAPTGVPANAAMGIALRYDTTNHKLWAYDNGTSTWKGVVLT